MANKKEQTPEEKKQAEIIAANEATIKASEDKTAYDQALQEAKDQAAADAIVPVTETAVKSDVESHFDNDEGLVGAQTTRDLASGLVNHDPWLYDEQGRRYNANDVKFNVKYSKSFKGTQTMPEGTIVVSREVAEQFEALGIGTIEQ